MPMRYLSLLPTLFVVLTVSLPQQAASLQTDASTRLAAPVAWVETQDNKIAQDVCIDENGDGQCDFPMTD